MTPTIGQTICLVLVILTPFVVMRHVDRKKAHLSVWQLVIRLARRFVNWLDAIVMGFDTGYSQYQQAQKDIRIDLLNEKMHGPVLNHVRTQKPHQVPYCPE